MRATSCVLAIAVAGCSSNYIPQSRGRVAVTMVDGKPAYVRDGRMYPHGILGGGLVDSVQGNPGAVAAANEYHSHMKTGLIATLLGTAAMLGGTIYITAEIAQQDRATSTQASLGAAAILGGFVVMMVGAGYFATAEPYRWDAINLFNDGADVPQGPPGWAPPPTASVAPPVSLKMRDE